MARQYPTPAQMDLLYADYLSDTVENYFQRHPSHKTTTVKTQLKQFTERDPKAHGLMHFITHDRFKTQIERHWDELTDAAFAPIRALVDARNREIGQIRDQLSANLMPYLTREGPRWKSTFTKSYLRDLNRQFSLNLDADKYGSRVLTLSQMRDLNLELSKLME